MRKFNIKSIIIVIIVITLAFVARNFLNGSANQEDRTNVPQVIMTAESEMGNQGNPDSLEYDKEGLVAIMAEIVTEEAAAEEVAVESSMKYEMLKGSDIMDGKVDI